MPGRFALVRIVSARLARRAGEPPALPDRSLSRRPCGPSVARAARPYLEAPMTGRFGLVRIVSARFARLQAGRPRSQTLARLKLSALEAPMRPEHVRFLLLE